ncbi:MAG: amidohydrolase family protein [Oscillospiraceae bacterium]|nr:amidohydrolase family protein [Oscillospiraceae bacterium]
MNSWSGTVSECHGHIILDGVAYVGAVARHQSGVDEAFVRRNLETCARHGIKFYRDGGDKHMVSVFAKKISGEYGIDYRTPAYIIHKRGYYGGMFGRAFDSMAEYRGLVDEAKRLDADFIKITASGMLDFSHGGDVTGPSLTADELSKMVEIAHSEGFAVMVHANGPNNIKRAAESGVDSIEHGFYMDAEALRIIAQTGAVWTPTCATVSNLIETGKYDDSVLQKILKTHKSALIAAQSIGVPIACGSDAGASCVPQGSGTRDELDILNDLGIDPGPGNQRIAEKFKKS